MTRLLMEPLRNYDDQALVRAVNRLLASVPGFGASTSVVEADLVIGTRDSEELWFTSEAWQSGEREVDLHVARGEISVFDDVDDLLAHLDEITRRE